MNPNDDLNLLRQQVIRMHQLTAMEADLEKQRTDLERKVRELDRIKLNEEADVKRLEGRSLAAFFYGVVGKLDEKLDKERIEAYAARVRYDAALRELEAVNADLAKCETELVELVGCKLRYEQALQQKANILKSSGSAAGAEILRLEGQLAALEAQQKELREAVSAGERALDMAKAVLTRLNSAEGWGTWDMLGGGLIADLAKHSELDSAQAEIERLQVQLRRFKTELADVHIQADMQVNVDGFLQFADFFFDGLFVDWTVMDQISQSIERVNNTKRQIENVLYQLRDMLRQAETDRRKIEDRISAVVIDG